MIVTVVGNRPQYIKMAPLSRVFQNHKISEFVIHTGQHYDYLLNDIFFKEMGIPIPNKQLNITAKKHGAMTAEIITQLEQEFESLKPKLVLLYGDTNSTLGAALAAVKLKIPIVHVEAGPRMNSKTNPEEINRIIVDHISTLLFCPDHQSVLNLQKENITQNVFLSGDLMYDAYLQYSQMTNDNFLKQYNIPTPFVLLTCHRAENVDEQDNLKKLLSLLKEMPFNVVFPIHPRTENKLKTFNLFDEFQKNKNIIMLPPLGYLDILTLLHKCEVVLTDSGGLQKEAYFSHKYCGVLLDSTPWPALKHSNWQHVFGFLDKMDISAIVKSFNNIKTPIDYEYFFGHGNAAQEIVNVLVKYL